VSQLKHLLDLTGGHNDVVEPELLADNMVKDSQNYEVLGQGGLTLRKEPEVYSATLNTYISSTLTMTRVDSISPPLYPQVKLASGGTTYQTNEFCLVVYGLDVGGTYEMYLLYGITGGLGWSHLTVPATGSDLLDGLTSGGIDWPNDGSASPEYSVNNNRMVITDGVNRAYYIEVDSDGSVTSGALGIPAPTVKIHVTEAETSKMSGNPNFTGAEGDSVTAPGLIQLVYTVVDEQGNESNPSPVSDTIDMQWLSVDVDYIEDRWIKTIPITNLTAPTLTSIQREQIKFFNVYVRSVKYASGKYSSTLQFTQQFVISDKTGANTYRVQLPIELGNLVSYEKDIAPIANHNAQISGITFLAGIQEKINFTVGDLTYYLPITITNTGNDYVDAIVRMRLYDEDAGTTPITSLEWDDFLDASTPNVFTSTTTADRIRLIDQDTKTTLNAYFEGDKANDYCDVWVKIPYLPNGSHVIYLAWSTTGTPVHVTGTAVTGRWISFTNFSTVDSGGHSAQTVIFGDFTRIPNQNTFFASPFNPIGTDPSLPTRMLDRTGKTGGFDINNSTSGLDAAISANSSISYLANTPTEVQQQSTKNNPLATLTGTTRSLTADVTGLGAVPKTGTVWFNVDVPTLAGVDQNVWCLTYFGATTPVLSLYLDWDGADQAWFAQTGGSGASTQHDLGLRVESAANRIAADGGCSGKPYFICFSWDEATAKASLFIVDVTHYIANQAAAGTDPIMVSAEIAGTITIPDDDISEFGVMIMGYDSTSSSGLTCPANMKVDEVVFMPDVYYDGSDTDDKNAILNVSSFMPPFPSMVGYERLAETHNNNIDMSADTETATLKKYANKIKWSDPQGVNFPDLYSKLLREPIDALISSPSFLQFQYENTLVIFTRNTITRFLLDGEPSTWVGDSNALVEEGYNAGIYAIDTLSKARDAMLWMSESGLIMWNTEGFRNISQNVIKIDLRDDSDLVGFYQPIRDQYILHDRTNDIGYVFHLRYGTFYKFKGLQLDQGIPRVLSGGTEDENINLMIWAIPPVEIMSVPNRTFAGAPIDWADVNLDTYSEAGSLTITAATGGQYCTLPIASAPMTAGEEYTLGFDVLDGGTPLSETWIIKDFTGVQTFGTVSVKGTDQAITFTVDTGITGGLRVVAGAASSEGEFDNFTLKPVGGIYKYPGDSDTTETAFIETKVFDHIRAVFNRFRFYFTGTPTIATHVIDNTLDPTELMPNQVDRDFSGASAWTNVDINSYNETGDLTLIPDAASQYCTCPVASMPMTAGVEYVLEYDYSKIGDGTWIFQDFTGVQEFGRVTSEGTDQLMTFTVDTAITGGLRIVSVSSSVSGSFDNFSLKTADRNESKSPVSGVYNWITNGNNLGEKIYFKITGAKSILSGMYEYLIRGAR